MRPQPLSGKPHALRRLHESCQLLGLEESARAALLDALLTDTPPQVQRTDHELGLGLQWVRRDTGRCAYSPRYITNAAQMAKIDIVTVERAILRLEDGEPVQGHLYVFRRPL